MIPTPEMKSVIALIQDAGGRVVGRTRLQKIAYLLNVTGLEDHFRFVYKHYGPFSEQLAEATKLAVLFDYMEENQQKTEWDTYYSIYTADSNNAANKSDEIRRSLISTAMKADAIVLELATTAIFLYKEYENDYRADPWAETKERKPEKATPKRLQQAKELVRELAKIKVPQSIPDVIYRT